MKVWWRSARRAVVLPRSSKAGASSIRMLAVEPEGSMHQGQIGAWHAILVESYGSRADRGFRSAIDGSAVRFLGVRR